MRAEIGMDVEHAIIYFLNKGYDVFLKNEIINKNNNFVIIEHYDWKVVSFTIVEMF